MQPVIKTPGVALATASDAPPTFEPILTVPAANEFDGLIPVELRFDQVAALAGRAHSASTAAVAASLTAIRRTCRRFSLRSPATGEAPAALRSGASRVTLNLIRGNGFVSQGQPD